MNKTHFHKMLISGLAYGLGLVFGNLVSLWIFNNVSMEWLASEGRSRLLLGIILAFLIAGFGGWIGGFIGGFTLDTFQRPKGRWGYAWRSASVFGIGYGILLFPLGLIVSLLSFYAGEEILTSHISLALALFGAVFGMIVGGLLGLLTVGLRRALRVLSASLLGFALGGAALGLGLRAYLYSVIYGQVREGQAIWLLLGLLAFGVLGGAFLGYFYSFLSAEDPGSPKLPRGAYSAVWRLALAAGVLVAIWLLFRPTLSQVRQLLTPQEANLARVLSTDTLGAHWGAQLNLTRGANMKAAARQPDLFATQDGGLAVTWVQDVDNETADILYARGVWDVATGKMDWGDPASVSSQASAGLAASAAEPQIALDRSGVAHLVWAESGQIFYSRCQTGECTTPRLLSNLAGLACAVAAPPDSGNDGPSIAIDERDNLMVAWRNGAGVLPFVSWPAEGTPPGTPAGCLPDGEAGGEQEISAPRLAAVLDGEFVSAYAAGTEIYLARFIDSAWAAPPDRIGSGSQPQVYVDMQGQVHAAWCDGNRLRVWSGDQPSIITDLTCASRPELAQDSAGYIHVVWYGDQVRNAMGRTGPHQVLYESIQGQSGWSPPAIVAMTGERVQPALASGAGSALYLAWTGNQNKQNHLYVASQIYYDCPVDDLSGISQVVYQVARQAGFRKPGDIIPYCRNHYDRLLFTPNSNPAFSDLEPTLNGAFDHLGDLIEGAQYEVLYSTMWYDKDANMDSPGSVIAQSVARLYFKLKEDPASYPRGLTVRILLGNPPELKGQLWYLLEDLRNAGVESMLDPEIGWRLEVADYGGSLPHSHVKTLIIDGKTTVAAGFNTTYDHFDIDHYSGQGSGRFDLGIQVSGPVAQESLRVFDDLWVGANRRHCSDFHPAMDVLWQATCYDLRASGGHVPEVLRYYLPGGDTMAFSMYRSMKREEADQQIVAALSSAQKSIDVVHVNFTMQLICDLNLLFNVCTAEQDMPYLDALTQAVEDNGVKVRILITPHPFEGIESLLAISILRDELTSAGVVHLVEVRFFEGGMHPKANLIDNQFLIIGSQNFHYSAFGEGTGLNEYSLGVSDPRAIEDFKRVYDYYWERSTIPPQD